MQWRRSPRRPTSYRSAPPATSARLTNVAAGINPTDAVNMSQLTGLTAGFQSQLSGLHRQPARGARRHSARASRHWPAIRSSSGQSLALGRRRQLQGSVKPRLRLRLRRLGSLAGERVGDVGPASGRFRRSGGDVDHAELESADKSRMRRRMSNSDARADIDVA